jgi:YgiT-type zinc finger domain-containing protein
METCPVCHIGSMRERRVTYTQVYKDQLIVIQGMPAMVCDFCGERWFDTEKVDGLQRLLRSDSGSLERLLEGFRQSLGRGGTG